MMEPSFELDREVDTRHFPSSELHSTVHFSTMFKLSMFEETIGLVG